jgi:hypothetical protein
MNLGGRITNFTYCSLSFVWISLKLNVDPAPWIENLCSISTHGFWDIGWLYARVQDHLTLSCNGLFTLFFSFPSLFLIYFIFLPNQMSSYVCGSFLGRQAYVSVSLATHNRWQASDTVCNSYCSCLLFNSKLLSERFQHSSTNHKVGITHQYTLTWDFFSWQ